MGDKNPCNCGCNKRPKCSTTPMASFPGYQECDKLDPRWVDAYTEIKLDPENPTGIILDTSWGEVHLDLQSIVKAGETVTHLELAPDSDPTVLRYTNEAGDYECITGDELSRIISLQLLKDVSQTTPPSDGIVYMYNGTTNLFEPFDLKTFVSNTNIVLGRIENSLTDLDNRLTAIENAIFNWATDKNTPIVRGVINVYGDKNATFNAQGVATSLDKSHGLYSHDINTDALDDIVTG